MSRKLYKSVTKVARALQEILAIAEMPSHRDRVAHAFSQWAILETLANSRQFESGTVSDCNSLRVKCMAAAGVGHDLLARVDYFLLALIATSPEDALEKDEDTELESLD
jgi:hypothetical protein